MTQRNAELALLRQAREEVREIERLEEEIETLKASIEAEKKSKAQVSFWDLQPDDTAIQFKNKNQMAFEKKMKTIAVVLSVLFTLAAIAVMVWSCTEIFPQVPNHVEEDQIFLFKLVHCIIAGAIALANAFVISVVGADK